ELRACTPRPPPKITSCIDWPRTARGDCSPIAHRSASVTFDLPEPFGPTTTLTPGPKSSLVRSGKDLKPFRVSAFRCMGRSDLRQYGREPHGHSGQVGQGIESPPAPRGVLCTCAGRSEIPSISDR